MFTWNGSSSGFWLNNPNWSSAPALPLTDDELVFPATGSNKDINNNPGGPVGLYKMTFSGSGYSLVGAQINLSTTTGGTPQIAAIDTVDPSPNPRRFYRAVFQ